MVAEREGTPAQDVLAGPTENATDDHAGSETCRRRSSLGWFEPDCRGNQTAGTGVTWAAHGIRQLRESPTPRPRPFPFGRSNVNEPHLQIAARTRFPLSTGLLPVRRSPPVY